MFIENTFCTSQPKNLFHALQWESCEITQPEIAGVCRQLSNACLNSSNANVLPSENNYKVARLAMLVNAALPAVSSRLRDKLSAADNGGVGATAPNCYSKILKVGYTAVTIRESASARRLAEHQRTAPQV
jgi:hypothetical protein